MSLPPALQQTITEKQYLAHIETYARFHKWLIYHTFDSRRSITGFPDLVLLRGSRQVVLEVKKQRGRVRPDQRMWLDAFAAAGAEAHAVWPEDDDFVRELLR